MDDILTRTSTPVITPLAAYPARHRREDLHANTAVHRYGTTRVMPAPVQARHPVVYTGRRVTAWTILYRKLWADAGYLDIAATMVLLAFALLVIVAVIASSL